MTRRASITPPRRAYRVSIRALIELDSLALSLDLPRAKIVDIALRVHEESGRESPDLAGELADNPVSFRLSKKAVRILRKAKSKAALIEASIDSLRLFLAEHSELPLRFLVSGRGSVINRITLVNS